MSPLALRLLDGDFTVCQVENYSKTRLDAPYCFLGKTETECSLVCRMADVPDNTTQREDGWRGFYIEGTLDFSLVGILSKIAALLAAAQIPIFAVSTFDTDYLFVKRENEETALTVLSQAGYEVPTKG